MIVTDDELKPDVAVTKVKGLLERDRVDFVVGPIFSNVLQAIHKPVTVLLFTQTIGAPDTVPAGKMARKASKRVLPSRRSRLPSISSSDVRTNGLC